MALGHATVNQDASQCSLPLIGGAIVCIMINRLSLRCLVIVLLNFNHLSQGSASSVQKTERTPCPFQVSGISQQFRRRVKAVHVLPSLYPRL